MSTTSFYRTIQESMQFYLENVVLVIHDYVSKKQDEVLSPITKNPPGRFVYRASCPKWVYYDFGSLPEDVSVDPDITPNDYKYINYEDGAVVYDYHVESGHGQPPQATYWHKVFRYFDTDMTEDDIYEKEIQPPTIIQSLDSGRVEPFSLGLTYERKKRRFDFDVYCRSAYEKRILSDIIESAFGVKHARTYGRIVSFDENRPLLDSGDKNESFDWESQTIGWFRFQDKSLKNWVMSQYGPARAGRYWFRYNVTVDTVEG